MLKNKEKTKTKRKQMDKWHYRFMNLAKEVASWSKDPSTKVGAVAVKDGRVLALGYNGFPRGVEDSTERYNNKQEKYQLVVHAEVNCIYNATYHGLSLNNADLYIYGLPCCNECAKGIIQVGIKRVFMQDIKNDDKWNSSWQFTKAMFEEAKIEYIFLD